MTGLQAFEQVAGLRPGEHGAWTFGDRDELVDVLAGFLVAGRRRGEELVLLGTPDRAELVELLQAVPGRQELLSTGQLRVASLRPQGGSFVLSDPERQVAAVAAGVAAALRVGWTGQRVAVLNTEVGRWSPEQRRLLQAYELAVDALFDRLPLTALCLYPAQAGHRLGPVLVLHPRQHAAAPPTVVPQVQVRARDGAFALLGELDLAVADEVEQALCAAAERLERAPLRVDLRPLDFLDLQGARALARVRTRLAVRGQRLELSGARSPADRCLRLVGLAADVP